MVRLSELANRYINYFSWFLNPDVLTPKPVANANNTYFTGTTGIKTPSNALNSTSHILVHGEANRLGMVVN